MPTKEEYVGGFLMGEAVLSMVFSGCKSPISQAGRLIRLGIGYYIYLNRLQQ